MAAPIGPSKTNFYAQIRNRSLDFESRLKLLRYCWKTTSVYIPNKEQVLLDTLVGTLIHKKNENVSEADVVSAWKCLQEILVSKKAAEPGRLLLKQSTVQLFTDTLTNIASTGDVVSSLIGCLYGVMRSDSLSAVFMAKLESMVSVLTGLCIIQNTGEFGNDGTFSKLVSYAVDRFLVAIESAPGQGQILVKMCELFLPRFIPLWCTEPSENVKKLSSTLLTVLSHRDHIQQYDGYLKAKHGILSQKNRKPKGVDHVFTSFASLLKVHPKQCSAYLPVFYDNYILRNSHKGILLNAYYMLVELCSLIGLRKHDGEATVTVLDDELMFATVSKFLEVVSARELYEVDIDEKNGHAQITFFRHIIQELISRKQMVDQNEVERSFADWYNCFKTLLQINHLFLEPKLQELLSVGWIDCQISDEDLDSLDKLLEELIMIYSKLRQIPKLMSKILASLCMSQMDRKLQIPPMFLKRYGEIIQSLPQGMILDIWKKFSATLKAHFVDANAAGCYHGVCELFRQFLLHVRVADYTVTDLTLKSVWELMMYMKSDIFIPLLDRYMGGTVIDNENLTFTLSLCEAWGEVVMMISFYSKDRILVAENALFASQNDPSIVHGYLSTKQWLLLNKLEQDGQSAFLQYMWSVLVMQKLRSTLLFKNKADWLSEANALTTVLGFLDGTDVNQPTVWSGKVEDITEESLPVGQWYLLTRNMAAIYSVLSDDQINSIASFAVGSISMNKHRPGHTLSSISLDFLRSNTVRENSRLLSRVVGAIWSRCQLCFTSSKQSSTKKKKKSELHKSVNTLMSLLSDAQFVQPRAEQCEISEKGKELSTVLSVILLSEDSFLIEDKDNLQCCIELLKGLMLDKIQPGDQIKCLVGLLSVKCVCDKSLHVSKDGVYSDLSATCVELSTVIIESCRVMPLFQIIPVDLFLAWLQNTLNQCAKQSQDYYKCMLLAEISCQAIVGNFGILEKLKESVNSLNSKVATSPDIGCLNLLLFLMQGISKFLSRPYLNENLKTTYQELFLSMAMSVVGMRQKYMGKGLTHEASLFVRVITTIVPFLNTLKCLHQQVLGIVEDLLKWCEKALESMVNTNVYAVMSALMFLQTCFRKDSLLKEKVDEIMKWRTWNLLVVLLKHLLSDSSTISSQSKNVSSPYTQKLMNDIATDCNKDAGKEKATERNEVNKDSELTQTGHTDPKAAKEFSHSQSISQILNGDKSFFTSGSDEDGRLAVTTDCHDNAFPAHLEEEDGVTRGKIHSLFHSLLFDGSVEEHGTSLVLMQVQSVMATLLVSFDLEHFTKVTQGLINDVHPDSLVDNKSQIQSSLLIWRYLLMMSLSEDQTKIIKRAAKDMMLNMHAVSHELRYNRDQALMRDVGIPILHVQRQMLSQGQKLLSSRSSILCLHCCLYTPLHGRLYFPAFSAVYEILDTLLIHHTDTVFLNVPSFIQCCKILLLSVVEQSNQDVISQKPDVIKQLLGCAYQMERLFSLISTHKKEFKNVAVYVIADYVAAVQKLTVLPAVKRALIPAVYKMLDLCDRLAISQLHVVLSHGMTEVFRPLYQEYNKFHKYHGKV